MSLPDGVNITDLVSSTTLVQYSAVDCSDVDAAGTPIPDLASGSGCLSLGETTLGELSMDYVFDCDAAIFSLKLCLGTTCSGLCPMDIVDGAMNTCHDWALMGYTGAVKVEAGCPATPSPVPQPTAYEGSPLPSISLPPTLSLPPTADPTTEAPTSDPTTAS